VYFDRSDVKLLKRSGDIRDWQIKCVCGKCNNGWMRRIENVSRLVMIPLILGTKCRVSPNQQKIIASWAILKAMIAEFDVHGHATTHHTQRKSMMKNQSMSMDTWTVWIGHYIRNRWVAYYGSIPFLYLSDKQLAKRTNMRATYYNSNISTQVVGQMFIHVIRSPASRFIKRWRFSTPDKGSLYRIWPPSQFSVTWPSNSMSDRDADYAASALANFFEDIVAKRRTPP
jgi:hypothetical protein